MTTDVIKQIRRATRRRVTAEEKNRIVLEGLRGEIPVTELCRQEGIQPSIYYKWSKAFLDSGKNGLTRETSRDATSGEVRRLKEENEALKKAVAEMVLENQKGHRGWRRRRGHRRHLRCQRGPASRHRRGDLDPIQTRGSIDRTHRRNRHDRGGRCLTRSY